METTVRELKIGSRLFLGKYSVRLASSTDPVVWLKGSHESDFITECIIDYLVFDAKERDYSGEYIRTHNNLFRFSNIHSFINSEEAEWYVPSHRLDTPPDIGHIGERTGVYKHHYGMLYDFSDYELKSIVVSEYEVDGVESKSLMRLPLQQDIFGEFKFPLFNRKGIRPHPTQDLCNGKRTLGYLPSSFAPFWCMDRSGDYVKIVDRAGNIRHIATFFGCGLRPVCNINPEKN